MRRTAIASILATAFALAYELVLWNTDLHQWSFLHWLNSIPQFHGLMGTVDFMVFLAIGTVLATIAVVGGATNRKFARSKGDVIQQLWVDANGVSGRKRTVIVLCASFVFDQREGYMDPLGCSDLERRWRSSDAELLAIAESNRQALKL